MTTVVFAAYYRGLYEAVVEDTWQSKIEELREKS
jgi:hypothetical protein